jgi:hypothetical protein
MLQALPDAEEYRFHPVLSIQELQRGEDIPVAELLDKATQQLEAFDGTIDAVIGFWDFPVSLMVPILCQRFDGLRCPSLEAVMKCEHKYWCRLEQQKVIDEYPRFGLVDPERDEEPPAGVSYPMWVKPVKSFSSQLAFGVGDQQEFRDALAAIRAGIRRVGEPFELILEQLDLPPEIAGVGGTACLVEEAISGRQATVEGYRYRGETRVYGVVDSVTYEDIPSFVRYQYPSTLPDRVTKWMADVAGRIMTQVGLDYATFNIEFFWDEATDTLKVLEVNPRHSQSHAELFADVDGAPNHQALVRLALGRDPELPHRSGPHPMAAKWFLRHFSDAVVRRHPSAEEVAAVQREIPGTTVDIIAHEGDRLSDLVDQDSYSYKIATIYVGADDEAQLKDKYERCVAKLPFELDDVTTGR